MAVERVAVTDRAAFLRRREYRVLRVLALVGLVALWEMATRTGWVPALFLPSPLGVIGELLEMARSGQLVVHLAVSLRRLLLGFALGAAAGVTVGVLTGFFARADAVGQPLIAATFPIPKIALLPLLILWLGIGEPSKVAVIALGVFFPMAINTYAGVRQADPLLVRAAVAFGAGRWSVIRKVILPSALPMIFAGLKLGAGTALLLLVAAEMIAAESGIGFLVLHAGNIMDTTKLMVGIVCLSLLGVLSHWALTRGERVAVPWRHTVCVLLGLLVAMGLTAPAAAQEKVKVGALKLTSSAPLFIGVEKGYFQEFGIEPELVFFQAAAPIATALATGQIDVGATGVTAALYNIVLGGEQMWIVADKGREWPGYPLTGIVVQKELYDGGLRGIADLKGRRIGITTLGSTFHFHLGNILEKVGLKLADVRVVPLQTMPAAIEALKGKQVDAILLPQPFPGVAESQGFGKILFWAGDLYPWQVATIFYSRKFAAERAHAVAFMKGYVKASRYYYDAVLVQKDGRLAPGANYDEVVRITAKYTEARPEVIRLGFPYQDRNGRLLVTDIERQMRWWTENGFMKRTIPLQGIVDTSFVEEAARAVPEK